jgi:hypothetical protein
MERNSAHLHAFRCPGGIYQALIASDGSLNGSFKDCAPRLHDAVSGCPQSVSIAKSPMVGSPKDAFSRSFGRKAVAGGRNRSDHGFSSEMNHETHDAYRPTLELSRMPQTYFTHSIPAPHVQRFSRMGKFHIESLSSTQRDVTRRRCALISRCSIFCTAELLWSGSYPRSIKRLVGGTPVHDAKSRNRCPLRVGLRTQSSRLGLRFFPKDT